MPATREDIRRWLGDAEAKDARWLVVKCDSFDYRGNRSDRCCYPVYCATPEQVWEAMDNADRTMEVYDLSMGKEKQMAEYRAWHQPPKPGAN